MSHLLSTSTNALLAFQRAMANVGHNVANIKTPGYSRQQIDFVTRLPTGAEGNGVQVADIRRVADQLATARLLDSQGELIRLDQLSALAQRADTRFSDKATGLAGPWSDFFDAVNALSAHASDSAARRTLLDQANSLSQRFAQLNTHLDTLNSEVNQGLLAASDEINHLAADVARLNAEISQQKHPSPDLLDQRERQVSELISRSGGTAMPQTDGSLNVYTVGGQALVIGSQSAQLRANADPYCAGRMQLSLHWPGQNLSLGREALGGKIGGLLEFADTVLAPARAELGKLAIGLAHSFNRVHRQGMDQYGQLGSDFFHFDPPKLLAHSANTGTVQFSARYSDNIAQLDGHTVRLRFDGQKWQATRADNAAPIPISGSGTASDPLKINGVELVLNGTPAAGDRFELQPVTSRLKVAVSDPSRIALASPVQASAGANNTGKAVVANIEIIDPKNPALLDSVEITFIDANHYQINGSAPVAYTPGQAIKGNGWQLQLEGTVESGDVFTLNSTPAGSGDNRNAAHLGEVENTRLFDKGRLSLADALAGLVAQTGSAARVAGDSLQAQKAIYSEAVAARESISGVNLDEEAANMLELQQAYQAASQMIASANTLFQSVLQAVSR